MDGHHDLVLRETEGLGRCGVVNLDDRLDLEVMVAGTQRAHFPALALLGAVRDVLGPRPGHRAALFDPFEIARLAPALLDGPAGAARQHGIHFHGVERYRPLAAEAGRDLLEQRVGERLLHGQNVGNRRPVSIVRTPQEMSNPTPPAETTPPSSGSNAATPPIGKP